RDLTIHILPPDVNESQKNFTVVEGGIRFGLAAIKNVGEAAVESIIETRTQSGSFRSFFEFCHRIDLRKVNKRMLEGLIKAGAFDSTGARRSQLMAVLEQAIEEGAAVQRERDQGQTSIFGDGRHTDDATADLRTAPLPDMPEWDQGRLLKYERELTGFYITAHPLARYETTISRFATATTTSLADVADGEEATLCGIISTVRNMTTKKGDRMAYFQLEDLQGLVEVIAFPDLYKSAGALITPECAVQVTGTVDRAEKGIRLKGIRIESLAELLARAVTRINIQLDESLGALSRLGQLEQVLRRHPGQASIHLTFCLPSDAVEAETSALPHLTALPNESFIAEVEEVLGRGSVSLM
ncbi:MAG: OB-fold nucleic acid binding domain-containing protein, partial [Nitrospiraceae bacterium]